MLIVGAIIIIGGGLFIVWLARPRKAKFPIADDGWTIMK